ncbi:MAG: dipeptidase [Saprospiraceae bacterium]
MKNYLLFIILILSTFIACTPKKELAKSNLTSEEQARLQKAKLLSKKYIIADGHVDLPYRLKVINFRFEKEYLGIPVESDKGDFDFVRSVEGGLDAPFMSIYLPAKLQEEPGASKVLADSLIDMVSGICETHPDKFEVAHWVSDVERIFKAKKIALPMGMENGSGLEDDLKNVAYFKKRGISYITLTHSKDNQICDSSYDTTRTWNGLSPYGYEVVREMNKQGIMVDISHVSDSTFYDVINFTKVPVIASHSSCRKYTPDFERNMNDDMLLELKKNGGVIMINFGSTFLDKTVQDERNKLGAQLQSILEAQGLGWDDKASEPIIEKFRKENPPAFSDVKMVANHIDNVVKIAGVNHVGFGSDFDGVGDSLPVGLKDVSQYPNLLAELLKRGYSEADIEKICFGNLARVWRAVEAARG